MAGESSPHQVGSGGLLWALDAGAGRHGSSLRISSGTQALPRALEETTTLLDLLAEGRQRQLDDRRIQNGCCLKRCSRSYICCLCSSVVWWSRCMALL